MLQILRGFSRDSVELKTSKQEVFNNLNDFHSSVNSVL